MILEKDLQKLVGADNGKLKVIETEVFKTLTDQIKKDLKEHNTFEVFMESQESKIHYVPLLEQMRKNFEALSEDLNDTVKKDFTDF